MAILFDWYENPKTSEQQGEENMLHPRLRLNGKVSTAQLRARIQKYCTLTETDVIAVLDCNLQIFLCLFLEKLNMPQNTPVTKVS